MLCISGSPFAEKSCLDISAYLEELPRIPSLLKKGGTSRWISLLFSFVVDLMRRSDVLFLFAYLKLQLIVF